MSAEQQAARDAAISIAEDCANRLRRQVERPSPHASVIINKGDLLTVLNALRTTPPPAAPGEITQEQARALVALAADMDKRALAEVHERWAYDPSCNTWTATNEASEAHVDTLEECAAAIRTALAGVPRE